MNAQHLPVTPETFDQIFVTYIFEMCASRWRIGVPAEVCATPRKKILGIFEFFEKCKIRKNNDFLTHTTSFLGAAQTSKNTQILCLEAYIQNM